MASGPKIPVINDGDALLGSTIRTALKNIQDFLGAIPIDNLEAYKCRVESAFSTSGTIAVNSTRYVGYRKVMLGAGSVSSKVYMVDFVITLNGDLAVGDSYTLTLEKSSSVGGTYSTVSGCSVTFDNTSQGTELPSDAANDFAYYKQVTPSSTEISSGEFIRLKIQNTAGGTRTIEHATVTVGLATMIQP
jgi:hypothetical protein